MSLPYKYEMLCRSKVVEIGRADKAALTISFAYLTTLPILHVTEGMTTYEVDPETGVISYLKEIDRSRKQLVIQVTDELFPDVVENGLFVVYQVADPTYKNTVVPEGWRMIDVMMSESKLDRRFNAFADIRHTLTLFEHKMYANQSEQYQGTEFQALFDFGGKVSGSLPVTE